MKRLIGNREKKNKKKNENTSASKEDNKDIKEVLQLFNKLEELVVDGDPRVRHVLNQKPGFQTLLRDNSSMFGLSPRSIILPNQEFLAKEPTNTSLLSHHQEILNNANKNKNVKLLDIPIQDTTNNGYKRHMLVPPLTLPERSDLGEIVNNGNEVARVRRHPDGTLESSRLEKSFITDTETKFREVFQHKQMHQESQTMFTKPIKLLQASNGQTASQKVDFNNQIVPKFNQETTHHSFKYGEGDDKSTVHIQLDDNNDKSDKTITSRKNKAFPTLIPSLVHEKYVDSVAAKYNLNKTALTDHTSTTLLSHSTNLKTAVHSKVIDEDGGELICCGCRIDVPKNAIQGKTLLQFSILDTLHMPYKTDRIFQYYNSTSDLSTIPISPTVQIEPLEIELSKPITVQLPTCISRNTKHDDQEITENKDIKAADIRVKHSDSKAMDVWTDDETEVFRSSDSVIFKLYELGSVCAFLENKTEEKEKLNKRFSLFLFTSNDNRKHQFVSIMLSDDLPHVIQKGIGSMPSWLKYTDSYSNIILPEGKNLTIIIEPTEESLSQADAYKMEIPWENMWYPESIIKKHIRITLLKLDAIANVQIFVDDRKIELAAQFLWKVKQDSIQMPNLKITRSFSQDNTLKNEEVEDKIYRDLYKKVTWKPETPPPQIITNKGLLNYATME